MSDWYIRPGPALFPGIIWRGEPPHLYLTFDDGPHDTATPAVLDVLKREQVPATFFLIGQRVEQQTALVQRMRDEGHTIGNHTFDHRPVWFRERAEVVDTLLRTQRAIQRSAGIEPTFFRPPNGRWDTRTAALASSVGLRTVLWGVNTWDFSAASPARIVRRVRTNAVPGDIVLLHDNDRTQAFIAETLTRVIGMAREAGFTFGRLTAN